MTGDEINEFQILNAWVSLAGAIACVAFVVAYALLARWWTSTEGKVMMGKAVAIGLLLLYTFLVVVITPDSIVLRGARVVVVASIGVFMVIQTLNLLRRQLKRNTDKREAD